MHKPIRISFTGAQSTGKTTLLNKMKSSDYAHWHYVDEVTRLVQREYNVGINEAGTDVTQLLILSRHLHNAIAYKDHDVIMDRCIVDGLVYTQWLFNNGKVTEQTLNYAEHLFTILISYVDHIFLTSSEGVKLQDDGVRSADVSFRNEIIKLFDSVLARPELAGKITVVKGTVDERYEQIHNKLLKLKTN